MAETYCEEREGCAIHCPEPLAQLVEHRPFKPRVVGSIPTRLTPQNVVCTRGILGAAPEATAAREIFRYRRVGCREPGPGSDLVVNAHPDPRGAREGADHEIHADDEHPARGTVPDCQLAEEGL